MVTAICIATGPSLTAEDVQAAYVAGCIGYAVNDAYKLAPWASVLYACDDDWWNLHEGVQDFQGERWTTNDEAAAKWGINHIPGTSAGLFGTEDIICYGKNSGFQAINLAYMHGHTDIMLLGYDMGFEPGTPKHFFGEHPRGIDRPSQYPEWIKHFNRAAPVIAEAGVKITNMTRQTALECFERSTF